MMYGASLTVAGFFYKCLLTLTLGNMVGGGVFTGAYLWFMYVRKASMKEKYGDDAFGDGEETPLLNGH